MPELIEINNYGTTVIRGNSAIRFVVSISNCPKLTSIVGISGSTWGSIFLNNNPNLGYFDIKSHFPNATNHNGESDLPLIYNLTNNGYDTETVNQILIDLDDISIGGYEYRELYLTGNSVPDTIGLVAKASLENKGFLVYTD